MFDPGSGNGQPSIDIINAKIADLKQKIDQYKIQHDLIFNPDEDTDVTYLAAQVSDSSTNAHFTDSSGNKNLSSLQTDINQLISDINTRIANIAPNSENNKAAMELNVAKLIAQNHAVLALYANNGPFKEAMNDPSKLEAEYEVAQVKITSNFNMYVFYLLFTIFIVVCLIYIYRNPESGNLDMFILVLAVIIFSYQIYDHYFRK